MTPLAAIRGLYRFLAASVQAWWLSMAAVESYPSPAGCYVTAGACHVALWKVKCLEILKDTWDLGLHSLYFTGGTSEAWGPEKEAGVCSQLHEPQTRAVCKGPIQILVPF